MADRYWVGGTNTWDTTAGTKWSTTSGGPGGASVPTLNDDVYFDQNSNGAGTSAFTVTIGSVVNCRNITVQNLDAAMTFAGSQVLNVYGNLTFPSTRLTYSNTRSIIIRGTNSIVNTGGVTIPNIDFGSSSLGIGSVVNESITLASSVTASSTIKFAANINSNGYTIQASDISISPYVVTIDLSNSSIFCKNFYSSSLHDDVIYNINLITNNTNLTLFSNGPYRTFKLSPSISPPTFSTVTLLSNITTSSLVDYFWISSGFEAQNLIIPESPNQRVYISLIGSIIVNDTIDIQSQLNPSSTKRIIVTSYITLEEGFQKNIGATTFSATNVDFYGIATNASTINCVRCGDYGFNSGITFDSPRTLYWSGTDSDVWHSAKWSLVSGQSGTELPPLAQDSVILDDTSNGSILITDWCATVKDLDTTNRSIPIILSDNGRGVYTRNWGFNMQNFEQFIRVTGNLTISDVVSFSGYAPFVFVGPGIHNILANFLPGIIADTQSGIVRMLSDLNIGTNITYNPESLNDSLLDLYTVPRLDSQLCIVSGTFSTNSYKLSVSRIHREICGLPNNFLSYAFQSNIYEQNSTFGIKDLDISNSEIDLGVTASAIDGDMSPIDLSGGSMFYSDGSVSLFTISQFNIIHANSKINIKNNCSGAVRLNTTYSVEDFPNSVSRNSLPKLLIDGNASAYAIGAESIESLASINTSGFTLSLYTGVPDRSRVDIQSWELSGSPGALITFSSSMNKVGGGTVETDYLSISNSTVTPDNTWYAGSNSVNVSNNIGWIFANPYNPATSSDFFLFLED